MEKEKPQVAKEVAALVLEHYQKLGKSGKPQKGEWTHLAAFCAVWDSGEKQALSIATGTKCLGASEVSKEGHSINDSHAEVLARRALIRYLLIEAQDVLTKAKDSKIVVKDHSEEKVRFRKDLRLYFFATHPPCGDASILPKLSEPIEAAENDETDGPTRAAKRRKTEPGEAVPADIHRTGAKCTVDGPQDARLPGVEYHQIGAWRTKPGRGERTLSMSCSDKLAKWSVMGVQGALLMYVFAEPWYIDSMIIGGKCPYSEQALRRAIVERNMGFEPDSGFALHAPDFAYSDNVQFPYRSTEEGPSPSHLSALWHVGMRKLEVLVDGYKQGVTLAKRHQESARSIVSRWSLAHHLRMLKLDDQPKTYEDLKNAAGPYKTVWAKLKAFYKYWVSDARKREAQVFVVPRD